jgi:thioredoxin 1
MPSIKVTDENFETEVIKASQPVVVDFWAEWCGPCKQIGPSLEEISEELKEQVIIAKHNIDDQPNKPTELGIKGIPTMLLFKEGKLKATKVGATTKSNIISWIKENI